MPDEGREPPVLASFFGNLLNGGLVYGYVKNTPKKFPIERIKNVIHPEKY